MAKKDKDEQADKSVTNKRTVMVGSDQGKSNIVKSNRLNAAVHNLSLPEMRFIQLAIVIARESGRGLSPGQPLRIHALQYANVFDISVDAAYKIILATEKSLYDRSFTFIDNVDGNSVKGRWLEQVKYLSNNGAIEVVFTATVVNEIFKIDGAKKFFTQYALKQTAPLKSLYSIRLYELTVQWLAAGKTPVFEVAQLRKQLEVAENIYQAMNNFKSRVLNSSVNEVNELTDLYIEYDQIKAGRTIVGFQFYVTKKVSTLLEKTDDETAEEITAEAAVQAAVQMAFEGLVVLTEKQAAKFSRTLAIDPDFATLIPDHYTTKDQKVRYLKSALRTPRFVDANKEHLERIGFNLASATKVDRFGNEIGGVIEGEFELSTGEEN